MLLLGYLPLPFHSAAVTVITRFITSAIRKIYKLRTERRLEVGVPVASKLVASDISIHFLIILHFKLFVIYCTSISLHCIILYNVCI